MIHKIILFLQFVHKNYNNEDETAKYKLVKHFKGYDVVKYGTWFDDSRKDLEDIYNDGDWELWWIK